MEKQGQCTWPSTDRRESRRCSQVPGQTDSGGNAVLAVGGKALCAETGQVLGTTEPSS